MSKSEALENMKFKILVIDDVEMGRTFVRTVLEKQGYIVEESINSVLGLEKTKLFLPDLIILDLIMDGGTGFEFLEKVRVSSQKLKEIPIIVSSSLNDVESIRKALGLGATDYIIKPFDPGLLLMKLSKLLKLPEFPLYFPKPDDDRQVTVSMNIQIKSATETGFVFSSRVKVEDDTVVSISSEVLDEMEYSRHTYRAVSSRPASHGEKMHYETDVILIGLQDQIAKNIRKKLKNWD